MGKFRNQTPEHKLFSQTLHDIKKLIHSNSNQYREKVMGTGEKTRMPYTHLSGRRKKLRQRHSEQKAKARQQGIQYDSSMPLLNQGLPQRQSKDQFSRNMYKFKGQKTSKFGQQKDGFLEITKKDVKRLDQRQGDRQKNYSAFPKKNKKFGKKKHRKGKKGR